MSAAFWADFEAAGLSADLVGALRDAYVHLKENFYLSRHRPGELEGGHFAEIAIRIVQSQSGGIAGISHTPLGQQLPRFDLEIRRLESLPATFPKSLRVHIPRALLAIYDIRNSRGVGHPSGDVNPNLADATLIVAIADWTLAEFVRLFHGRSLDEAQAVVDSLVTRRLPMIQKFGDFPKVLRTGISVSEKALILVLEPGSKGVELERLAEWLRVDVKETRRIVRRHDQRAFVHFDENTDRVYIAEPGIVHVEATLAPTSKTALDPSPVRGRR